MDGPFLIAEIGASPAPEWDFDRWIAAAVESGANAIKVQMFWGSHFPQQERAEKAKLEFPRKRWGDFVYRAHAAGLRAGASVFDEDALRQVLEYGDFVKVAAREQTNSNLLRSIATMTARNPRRIPIYQSVNDVSAALRKYPLGVENTFSIGQVILVTISRYPTPLWRALLKVCEVAVRFDDRVWGWSSHTTSALDCRLAVRMGAEIVEKHLAIEQTDLEAGHALLVKDFKEMSGRIHDGTR